MWQEYVLYLKVPLLQFLLNIATYYVTNCNVTVYLYLVHVVAFCDIQMNDQYLMVTAKD